MSKRIVKLSANDVLRLSAVEITPRGNVITLGGKNGAGKSSVLSAIQMALGGKRAMPKRPIRAGAERANVVLDLGDIVVERVVTEKTDRLVVKNRDGATYPKPQQLLDRLFTAVSFDPLAFTLKKPPEQAEQLRKLLGVKLDDCDAEGNALYERRAAVNRQGEQLRAVVDQMPEYADAPEEEISAAELVAELERRETQIAKNRDTREALAEAEGAEATASMNVAEITKELERARALVLDLEQKLLRHQERAKLTEQERNILASQVAKISDPDLSEVKSQIKASEDTNRQVRANRAKAEKLAELDALRGNSQELTDQLKVVRAERERRIAAAKFPVPDLGFGPDGLTLNGHPFEQASRAEQIRVSVAVGIAANPELRVFLVRDGSVLDEDSLSLLSELADSHDCQIWLEDARTRDETAIIIEDGCVRGATAGAERTGTNG